MLKRLHLRNFTVFTDAEFEFEPGLNVLVGTNGTGKTHVLKAGYVMLSNLEIIVNTAGKYNLSHELLDFLHQERLQGRLAGVFQLVSLQSGELIRRNFKSGESSLSVVIKYSQEEFTDTATLSPKSALLEPKNYDIYLEHEKIDYTLSPVFIPAKEVLTLGWLLSLYGRREVPIDETYPDLLKQLSGPPLRHPKPTQIVEKLAQLIGGKVEEEGGHFYLSAPDQPRLEMNLVAEGMRKFATLYKLLANGTLTPETTLFWDEPEANLNPALLKEMAVVLTDLAQAGFQVILATHSLFLLKELHMLAQERKAPVRYFGLSGQPGEAVAVATADNLELLPDIVALDAELAQSDRFQRILDQADADRS